MSKKTNPTKPCINIPTPESSFAKSVEKLIDPINVGTIHFIQQLNQLFPKKIQKALMNSSSKKIPFMGFVVEPYSSFLCYEIRDTQKANELLPDDFRLVRTSIFTDDEPKYYCIFGSFRAHTSAFWGARTEFYVIAEDKRTGLLSWVIIDYDTNTISYDSKRGLVSPNSDSIITINHRGNLFVDIQNKLNKRKLKYSFDVEKGRMNSLDQRLWLEGNLSVGYGKDLAIRNDSVFSLKFEPCEVEKALEISRDDLVLESNTWLDGMLFEQPEKIVCFPYSQHFISDSPGASSKIKNEQELVESIKAIDFANTKVLSVKYLKYMFIFGSLLSLITTITLVTLYIFK
ncbi:hypothetical protein HGB25_01500 [Candidatus Saccharibacteria bacterium]|nr:hypothetical protein [Candidatus Saccharibacteria bacterium]